MRLLFDTQMLIWFANGSNRLKGELLDTMREGGHTFSLVSLWEVVIKTSLNRLSFQVDPLLLRSFLLQFRWEELVLRPEHVAAVSKLPLHHGDPFDRMLVAQAQTERMMLVTMDTKLRQYAVSTQIVP